MVREMERQSKFQEAFAYAQRAVSAEPGNYAAHAMLGCVLVSMDRNQEGLHDWKRPKRSSRAARKSISHWPRRMPNWDAEKARAEFLRLKNLGSGKQ